MLLALLLSGCQADTESDPRQRTFVAMGTLVTIDIQEATDTQAETAFDQIEALLLSLQNDWHGFGDGELARVNAALAKGQSVQTNPELSALISRSLRYRNLSDGLFDPVIGELVELWGFDNDVQGIRPPTEAALEQWRTRQYRTLELYIDRNTLQPSAPLKLDLGGVAKGTALSLAATLLLDLGIQHGLVEAGGDVQAIGSNAGRPWLIGIRDPRANKIMATIELESGEAIVTSGDYERFFEHEGQRYHHLLDPSTGRPVSQTSSVTVIHRNAELADAAATALMVAGPERFKEISDRMGIDTALLIDRQGGQLITPLMQQRLKVRP
ncbi:MAG: FAD:protein FMN transferase [Gammaproteobacteria bacterium]|nr:FAD:protein FMN transferase [Gammaproteobacteria bacterium]